MSALYLSMSKDHASSLPERHSLTRRVSSQAAGVFFVTLAATGLIEKGSPDFSDKAVPHSRAGKAPEQPAENCRANSWHPRECPGLPGKSLADSRRESPGRGHRAFCAARMSVQSFAHQSGGRSPLPIEWRDALATDSKGESRRSRAKH